MESSSYSLLRSIFFAINIWIIEYYSLAFLRRLVLYISHFKYFIKEETTDIKKSKKYIFFLNTKKVRGIRMTPYFLLFLISVVSSLMKYLKCEIYRTSRLLKSINKVD
jgi:hypothetical protein